MSKQIRTVACSIAVLAVAVLLVTFGHKVPTVNAGPRAPVPAQKAQASDAVPCDTTKSGAATELCGTSTDPGRWWNAAGEGSLIGGSAWHTQPTFFPPDVAYTRYAIPKG